MRSLTAFVGAAALVLFTAPGALAQGKPDFSGTWTMAQAAGGGPGGPPRQLTLTQDTDTLAISWTEDGTTTTMPYRLDGSESRNLERPGAPAVVSRARWDDNRLVIATPQRVGGREVEQRNVLTMDGGFLVLETDRIDLGGERTVVRLVYTKSG